MNINDTRSQFNKRMATHRPLASTRSFPIQQNIPFLDMKPINTKDSDIKKTERNVLNYQELLQNYNKPIGDVL